MCSHQIFRYCHTHSKEQVMSVLLTKLPKLLWFSCILVPLIIYNICNLKPIFIAWYVLDIAVIVLDHVLCVICTRIPVFCLIFSLSWFTVQVSECFISTWQLTSPLISRTQVFLKQRVIELRSFNQSLPIQSACSNNIQWLLYALVVV